MRYLIGLPICLVVISGLLWFTSRGSYHLAAMDPDTHSFPNSEEGKSTPRSGSSSAEASLSAFDPITVSPCTLMPIQEQNVASQVDGMLTDVHVALGAKVQKGDCLAQLDDQKLQLQIELLQIKADSVSAEKIAEALYEEADAKVKYAEKANAGVANSVPELEIKTYLAQRERFNYEIKKAREDRLEASKELEKAKVHLQVHPIRTALSGEVVRIFKKPGETVKQGETLFRIARLDRLGIEGFCKVQHAPSLRPGQRVLVEAELQGAQAVALIGHTAPVNDLAMARDGKVLASAGDDGNVLLWSWPAGGRLTALHHAVPVYAVDIIPLNESSQTKYLIATAGEDRIIRIWIFSPGQKVDGPVIELLGHEGAIRTVSLSPDGGFCVSGGEDRLLGRWDLTQLLAKGSPIVPRWLHGVGAWKKTAHQGTITSTRLTADGTLISTGSDNVQKVWQIDSNETRLLKIHRGRTGDVSRLGVSLDGSCLLSDHGDELRILCRDGGTVLGTLQNSKHVRFEEFACFSPTQRLILAASADGRLQLSKTPLEPKDVAAHLQALTVNPLTAPLPNLGGFEVRHYQLPKAAHARCGVFAPDESVFFTAGSDRTIRAWSIPPAADWEPREAVLTYVGSELEPGTDLVRIQAELPNPANPSRWWRPGTTVRLKIIPTAMVSTQP